MNDQGRLMGVMDDSPGNASKEPRSQAGQSSRPDDDDPGSIFVGCLHHCLTKRTPYDELTAFPTPTTPQLTIAA